MGKTVTTELAYMHPARTRNPLNLEHSPGGSSSGSAAAVAAGMVPIAVGTWRNRKAAIVGALSTPTGVRVPCPSSSSMSALMCR